MVRWIPLGAITDPALGTILLGSGVVGILYALLFGWMRAAWNQFPIYAIILATGVSVMSLGLGLADPAVWNLYGVDSGPVFFAAVGLGFVVIIIGLA